jgi:naphthoate synthase
MVGQKKAREYSLGVITPLKKRYGMVNAVIPHDELEATAYEGQEILGKSPIKIKCLLEPYR